MSMLKLLLSVLLASLPMAAVIATPKPISTPISGQTVVDIPDFAKFKDVWHKKKAFFNFMRPIVEAENQHIQLQRERLKEIQSQSRRNRVTVNKADMAFLLATARAYHVDIGDIHNDKAWSSLLSKVDTVPLRLVLAQSANESSWGTSRFARKGKNFFGQWCFKKGCGLVPLRRARGLHHEVAAFKTVNASVAAYLKNINTGRVYHGLRQIRQRLRQQGSPVTAHQLAGGLLKYSERGLAYVKEIRAMIRVNYILMKG